MRKRLQTAALMVAAGALLAVPAIGEANKPDASGNHNHPTGKCKKPTVNKGFVVKGTLVTATADDPTTTNVNEATVVLTVTGANKHARNSGIDKGETYTADGTPGSGNDAFKVQLSGYEGADTPSAGDKVRVTGKIPYTKKKCASSGTSLEDRYGDPNIRRVKVIDSDPDA